MDNKWNIGEGGEMPIGFGLSLAANEKSMEALSNHMHSREDMEQFVDDLGKE